ncbi:hypothetical protein P167DRAFT_210559 [Morchella conica CCBAS932]|uniref:Uncharacterized protein n=1 Tax=Morchella conica CCBAS932 TaxID=1392247 RepID=A0A3N4KM36_9PEZI|nr:hypothetical protein P167DRAFT_210559 [Morchella conica CCBAS932]
MRRPALEVWIPSSWDRDSLHHDIMDICMKKYWHNLVLYACSSTFSKRKPLRLVIRHWETEGLVPNASSRAYYTAMGPLPERAQRNESHCWALKAGNMTWDRGCERLYWIPAIFCRSSTASLSCLCGLIRLSGLTNRSAINIYRVLRWVIWLLGLNY